MERKNKNKFPFQSVVHAIGPSHLIAFSQKDFPGDASGKEPDCQCRRCKRYRECASLVAQLVKEFTCNAGDPGSIPGLGSSPGEGTGYQL